MTHYTMTTTDRLETLYREAGERLYWARLELDEAWGEHTQIAWELEKRRKRDALVARREGGVGLLEGLSVGGVVGVRDGGVGKTVT